jgi:hypothetical protein
MSVASKGGCAMSQQNSGSGRKRGNSNKDSSRFTRSAPAAPVKVESKPVAAAPAPVAARVESVPPQAQAPMPQKPVAAQAPAAAAPVAAPTPAAAAPVAAQAPAAAAPVAAPLPAANPADAENDALMERFEHAQKRFGPAYAAMSEGLRGEGIDKLVRYVQYGLAAAAVFVVVAAVFSA